MGGLPVNVKPINPNPNPNPNPKHIKNNYSKIFYTGSCCIFSLFDMIYIAEIENKMKSVDPRTNKGKSVFIWLYTIHKEEDTIFIMENTNEYGLLDLFVYNRYIKINLPNIEILIAK